MKNVLITGAGPNGFVGRNLSEMLNEKYKIFAPSSRVLNLCDYEAVSKYIFENNITTVVHSAVHNPRNRGLESEIENNLKMYFNFEKLADSVEKIIYFGSGAEFDKRYPIDMVIEEQFGDRVPIDPYGFTKYIMNKNCMNSRNIYNLRLFGIFGKYEYWQAKFISNLCCKAIYDLTLTVRQNCLFDFLYINDLPSIVEWFIENDGEYRDYNVCYGTPIDLISIAKIIKKISGKDLKIEVFNQGFNLPYTADNTRLKQQIPDIKLTDYEESIEDLYKYYYDNKSSIDYETLTQTK